MSCFVAISTSYIFGTLLTANGNLRELNLMAASGILINITMNLFLIPRFQAAGSAVSSLITQFLTAFIQVLIAQNVFKFKINYPDMIKSWYLEICDEMGREIWTGFGVSAPPAASLTSHLALCLRAVYRVPHQVARAERAGQPFRLELARRVAVHPAALFGV